MNILDRLFSREINRRTGAHAINIYIESQSTSRQKSRSTGTKVLKATAEPDKTSLFHRLDVRFPWLKLAAVCIIGIVVLADLCNLTISRSGDPYDKIRIAPMSRHVRATERVLDGKMLVALTFDDGPSSATTPRLLDVLAANDVPATFFMLGNMARSNPDIVKNIKQAGHDIASHTMYHQNLVRIPTSAAQSDINEANSIIASIIGQGPSFTRPPYGNFNSAIQGLVGTPIILWSVDTLDWQSKDVGSIVATTLSQVHDGAIILMHDIYPTSVDAVPEIIKSLRGVGYEFVTISELAKYRHVALTPGAAYYNFRP